MSMQSEEKHNELLETFALAEKLAKPYKRFLLHTSYNIRKPLFFYTKVLLMTQNIEQAEKTFNLPREQINDMRKKAAQFINKHIQEKNKKYAPIAIWLYNLISIQPEKIISDPDKLILTALFEDKTLDSRIKYDFWSSIKEALHVADPWISDKIMDNLAQEISLSQTSQVEPDAKPDSTAKLVA